MCSVFKCTFSSNNSVFRILHSFILLCQPISAALFYSEKNSWKWKWQCNTTAAHLIFHFLLITKITEFFYCFAFSSQIIISTQMQPVFNWKRSQTSSRVCQYIQLKNHLLLAVFVSAYVLCTLLTNINKLKCCTAAVYNNNSRNN